MGIFVCPVCGADGVSDDVDREHILETAYAEIDRLGIDDPPADSMAHFEAKYRVALAEYVAAREEVDESPSEPDTEYSYTCTSCSIREQHRGRAPMEHVALGVPIDRDEWDEPGPMADM